MVEAWERGVDRRVIERAWEAAPPEAGSPRRRVFRRRPGFDVEPAVEDREPF
jgi:hypothetical protein